MDRSRSRGQIILVAGVGIAVTFVALALILNTVIYTENLSTRQSVDGQDTIVFERAADDGVGGLVSQVNYYDYASYEGLRKSVRRSTAAWDNQSVWSEASRGSAVSVDVVGITNGTHIIQGTDRKFTSDAGDAAWTLASGVTATRRFKMNVSRSSLKDGDTVTGLLGKAYEVEVSDGTDPWRLNVYEKSDDVVLEVVYPNGTTDTGCRYNKPRVTIDVTGGTVEGRECDLLEPFAKGVTEPYSISYSNADLASGKYTLIVDEPISSSSFSSPPYSGQIGTSPYAVGAIYGVTLNVTVEDDRLDYTSTVTVAPERPAGGETYEVYVERRELVYVSASTNYLSSIHPNGTITRYDVKNVEAIGPKSHDLDGDDLKEVPYVNGTGVLKLIDANNETQILADGAQVDGALIGVGEWRGNLSVFYVNKSDNKNIWRVAPGREPSKVTDTPTGTSGVPSNSVGGIADFNGDGDPDLVYLGSSSTVHYLDGGEEISTGQTASSKTGYAHGFGAPRHFDSTGPPRSPYVSGSSYPALINYKGDVKKVTEQDKSYKVPVAGVNFAGGPALELAFIGSSDGKLRYATLGGDVVVIEGPDGAIQAKPTYGVA